MVHVQLQCLKEVLYELGKFWKALREITSELEKLVTEGEIPGIYCGVRFNDTVETASLGVTNIDHPLKVNDETFFRSAR